MGITKPSHYESDAETNCDALHEARNEAFRAYDAAGQALAEATSHPSLGVDVEAFRKERDAARDAFIHAEHEWRHALNALDSGTRALVEAPPPRRGAAAVSPEAMERAYQQDAADDAAFERAREREAERADGEAQPDEDDAVDRGRSLFFARAS